MNSGELKSVVPKLAQSIFHIFQVQFLLIY
jgi:hypothetical protein